MKQLKQLQRKPRKNSEASTGFEAMTSVIELMTSVILLSYEALLGVDQEWVQYLPTDMKSDEMYYTLCVHCR